MSSDNCYIKRIPNDITIAKTSFVNSISFLCGMMLLNFLKELAFCHFSVGFLLFFPDTSSVDANPLSINLLVLRTRPGKTLTTLFNYLLWLITTYIFNIAVT